MQYAGFCPSGPWAEHFGIICWPISHAVLPTDLQRVLVNVLAELFARAPRGELLDDPALLGQHIEALAHQASSRFRNLAQEHALLGRISQALLRADHEAAEELLLAATRERILADLRLARGGARALEEARDRARSLAVHGLGGGRGGARGPRNESAGAAADRIGPPRLALYPSKGAAWRLVVEVPCLAPLAAAVPAWADALRSMRPRLAGEPRRVPRGALLQGGRIEPLSRLPPAGPLFLRDESVPADVGDLLETLLSVPDQESRLFARRADGRAVELRSSIVRPGREYLLLRRSPPPRDIPGLREAGLECRGAWLGEFNAARRGESDGAALAALGLSAGEALRLRPAGLPPCDWDAEGRVEYLAGDEPCFALTIDAAFAALRLSLDGAEVPPLVLERPQAGEVLVSLPALTQGAYALRLEADRDGWRDLGALEVAVRAPRPWAPGASHEGLLRVEVAPADASLEQLWSGLASIAVSGPAGAEVRAQVVLSEHEAPGERAHAVEYNLGAVSLPLQASDWRALFQEKVTCLDSAAGAYDRAEDAVVSFRAEGVGAASVRLSRAFTPLRWRLLRGDGGAFVLRLSDEADNDAALVVGRASFAAPMEVKDLTPATFDGDYAVGDRGGLFIARRGVSTRAIVVPPRVRGFADMRISPQLKPVPREVEAVIGLLDAATVWRTADCPSRSFAPSLLQTVGAAFSRALALTLCGDGWASAEDAFVRPPSETDPWRPYRVLRSTFSRAEKEHGIWRRFMDETHAALDEPLSVHVERVVKFREAMPWRAHRESDEMRLAAAAEFALRAFLWPGRPAAREGAARAAARYLLADTTTARLSRGAVLAVRREERKVVDDYPDSDHLG